MTRLFAPALVLMLAAASAFAQPADDPKAKAAAHYAEGQTAYQAGDFKTAATRFMEAYGLDQDPVYLFNAAQAYRFGNDCALSAKYYAEFLAKVPNPPNKDKVNAWLAQETQCSPHEGAKPTPTPTPTPTPHTGSEAPSHTLSYAVGGAGIASIVVGVLVYTQIVKNIQTEQAAAIDRNCKVLAPPDMPCASDVAADINKHYQDRGDAAVTKEFVLYGIGVAALAASAYLYVRAGGHREEQPPVSIAPTNGGAMVVGGFTF